MKIHLIRHTTPEIAEKTCYGQADLALVASAAEEITAVKAKLLERYDIVYTSPLQRCALLAKEIKADKRVTESRILEYSFGDWELKPWDDIRKLDFQSWAADQVNVPAPNGESLSIMQTRVLDFFAELLQQEHKNVAVVTHSGVQRILHAHTLKTPLKDMFRLQLDFGAVIELLHNSQTGRMTVKHL